MAATSSSPMASAITKELADIVANSTTPAAIALKNSVGGFSVEELTVENAHEAGAIVAECFVNEPLGLTVGFPLRQDDKTDPMVAFFSQDCKMGALKEKFHGVHPSLIVRAGGQVIAAMIISLPEPPQKGNNAAESDEGHMDKEVASALARLLASFKHVDTLAAPIVSNGKWTSLNHIPESEFGAVAVGFRGPLGTIQNEGSTTTVTLFQFLAEKAERIIATKWDAVYTHSNQFSAAQRVKIGYEVVVKVPYNEIPEECRFNPQSGGLHLCFKRLRRE
ncbi:hypothetical protein HDU76_008636 [Blyttiomyces sp. JEL0837]|nr:hypothetical protein HDU76_008636 [Blyttiomyces sp. JEL0837]